MPRLMDYDPMAWKKSDEILKEWKDQLFQDDTFRAIGNFIKKYHEGRAVELHSPTPGSFNICFRLAFADGRSVIIRLPKPGVSAFAEEKTRGEVAVMRCIRARTSIPVPLILGWGSKNQSPQNLAPYIIMHYIDHEFDAIDLLGTPGQPHSDRPILDPGTSEERLASVYSQMANILLQMSTLSFSRIGAIEEVSEGRWEATKRPLTYNTNELVQLANFPPSKLPTTTFKSSYDYFVFLAETHLTHLITQRNDAIKSADDCREKFVARKLFLKLAKEGKLTAKPERTTIGETSPDAKPFKLFCDDFRPANVLIGADKNIVGVIDWEFSYAAPPEFAHSPPWWLILEMPQLYPEGIDAWESRYSTCLDVFLTELEKREQEMIAQGRLAENARLSGHMRESWVSGDFWVVYAARKSWAFDMVFWARLNRRFFGGDGGWEERLGLLSGEERVEMEGLVERKVEEMETRGLVDWSCETTR